MGGSPKLLQDFVRTSYIYHASCCGCKLASVCCCFFGRPFNFSPNSLSYRSSYFKYRGEGSQILIRFLGGLAPTFVCWYNFGLYSLFLGYGNWCCAWWSELEYSSCNRSAENEKHLPARSENHSRWHVAFFPWPVHGSSTKTMNHGNGFSLENHGFWTWILWFEGSLQ